MEMRPSLPIPAIHSEALPDCPSPRDNAKALIRIDGKDARIGYAASCHAPKHRYPHRRRLLYHTMLAAGFINYSEEWWHYSYGDRLWARTFGKTPFYGFAEEDAVRGDDKTNQS